MTITSENTKKISDYLISYRYGRPTYAELSKHTGIPIFELYSWHEFLLSEEGANCRHVEESIEKFNKHFAEQEKKWQTK